MTPWDVIAALTLLAFIAGGLAWLADRHPCNHPEWVDLGDGDAVCEECSEVFQLEEICDFCLEPVADHSQSEADSCRADIEARRTP